MTATFGNGPEVIAYTIRPGVLVHPECYFEASKPMESKWRGREIQTIWHRTPKKGWKCAICDKATS